MQTSEEIVRSIIDAYLSSQEETLFGEFMEKLAIYVSGLVRNGQKSTTEGIDLEITDQSKRFIVTIKSGPNLGNSSQIARMKESFSKAKRIYRTQNTQAEMIAVNGCCYGKDNAPDKGDYFKFCGQRFWEFLTEDADFYIRIIDLIGFSAQEKNEEFQQNYYKTINRFVKEFSEAYCFDDGEIDWHKIVQYNSGS